MTKFDMIGEVLDDDPTANVAVIQARIIVKYGVIVSARYVRGIPGANKYRRHQDATEAIKFPARPAR